MYVSKKISEKATYTPTSRSGEGGGHAPHHSFIHSFIHSAGQGPPWTHTISASALTRASRFTRRKRRRLSRFAASSNDQCVSALALARASLSQKRQRTMPDGLGVVIEFNPVETNRTSFHAGQNLHDTFQLAFNFDCTTTHDISHAD